VITVVKLGYELDGGEVPIPDAQTREGFDNSLTFNELIKWVNTHIDSVLVCYIFLCFCIQHW